VFDRQGLNHLPIYVTYGSSHMSGILLMDTEQEHSWKHVAGDIRNYIPIGWECVSKQQLDTI
jgi:hypothetical protein